jgi:hypothetical protein
LWATPTRETTPLISSAAVGATASGENKKEHREVIVLRRHVNSLPVGDDFCHEKSRLRISQRGCRHLHIAWRVRRLCETIAPGREHENIGRMTRARCR